MRPQAGFTLTELLVAMALGGLLVAAALASAALVGRRHSELDQVMVLRERAEHALAILAPEIQLAGFGGLAPQSAWAWPSDLPSTANACGTLRLPPSALQIATRYALACAPQGGGAGPQSDVLTVLRAGARLATPSAGRLQVLGGRRSNAARRVIVDGRMPAEVQLVPGRDELRDLELQTFYVSRDSDGMPAVPALRLKALTAIEGRATIVDQELVPGVEMLCIETAEPSDGGIAFTHAPAAFAAADMPRAVRVSLLMRSEKSWDVAREQVLECADRRLTRHDAYLRQRVSRTWALRNAAADGAS